jgi:osmotically-inducible protein OsmY
MKKYAALIMSLALVALAAGCSDTANSNAANSNTAVVVNSNANNANHANTNANANTSNANRYSTTMTKEDYEKNKESYATEAKGLGSKIGAGATDGYLWMKTRAALLAADDLRDSTINVDVDNSVITLRGDVATKEQMMKADTVAKGIDGQKGVKNMLAIKKATGNTNANSNANANANATSNANKAAANANTKH